MKKIALFICFLILSLAPSEFSYAQGKKRIDLDDLMIKGELHGDDRLLILTRQKNDLKNFIKFRTNYKEEILQEQFPVNVKRKK